MTKYCIEISYGVSSMFVDVESTDSETAIKAAKVILNINEDNEDVFVSLYSEYKNEGW